MAAKLGGLPDEIVEEEDEEEGEVRDACEISPTTHARRIRRGQMGFGVGVVIATVTSNKRLDV